MGNQTKLTLDIKLIRSFDHILIFTQKRRDVDTIAGATAIATILKRQLPDKKIYILGNHRTNHRVPEASQFSGYRRSLKGRKLAILSEITYKEEVEDPHTLSTCQGIIIFNHHESKPIGKKTLLLSNEVYRQRLISEFNIPEAPAVCWVIWKWIEDMGWGNDIDAPLGGLIFRGIYADTNYLSSSSVNSELLRRLWILTSTGVDIPQEILRCQRIDFRFHQVYIQAMKKAEFKDGILFINFVPDCVKAGFPYLVHYNKKEKKAGIFRTRLFTWVFRKAVNEVDANTVIFAHYSNFDPFYNPNKVVYIALNKENPQLEALLKRFKFEQAREGNNIFTRIMNYTDLTNMISQNYSTFVGDYEGFEEEEQDQEE